MISHVTIIPEQTLDVHREHEQHTPRQRNTAETAQARRQRTTENAQKTHRRAPIGTPTYALQTFPSPKTHTA